MAEFRHVHCTFCHQTYVSASSEACALCCRIGGLVSPGSLEALRDVVQAKQAEGRGLKLSVNPRVVIGVFVLLGAAGGFLAAVAVRSTALLLLMLLLCVAGLGLVVSGLGARNG